MAGLLRARAVGLVVLAMLAALGGVSASLQIKDACPSDINAKTLCQTLMKRVENIEESVHLGCPSEFPWKFGARCFRFSSDLKTCDKAEEACKERNGILAEVKDEDTNDFLRAVSKLHANVQGYWIGGKITDDTNEWQWRSDNSPFQHSFHPWAEDRPTVKEFPTKSMCVELRRGSDYRWNDLGAEKTNNYICEMDMKREE